MLASISSKLRLGVSIGSKIGSFTFLFAMLLCFPLLSCVSGRLRRPDIVIHVCVYFVCADAYTKYTQTCTKGRVAAAPQYVRGYCLYGLRGPEIPSQIS